MDHPVPVDNQVANGSKVEQTGIVAKKPFVFAAGLRNGVTAFGQLIILHLQLGLIGLDFVNQAIDFLGLPMVGACAWVRHQPLDSAAQFRPKGVEDVLRIHIYRCVVIRQSSGWLVLPETV